MQPVKKSAVKDYFTFTRKERRAVLLLLSITVILTVLPFTMHYWVDPPPVPVRDAQVEAFLRAAFDTTHKAPSVAGFPAAKASESGVASTLFAFDPNTATPEIWKRLGVSDRTIQTLLKYRSKGGRFKQATDLYRIYGLPKATADRLIPYVQLPSAPGVVPFAATEHRVAAKPPSRAEVIVDINAADTTVWKQLRGIGSGYAKRIVGYRNKLGGFVRVEQVGETFGLPDSLFQRIRPFLKLGTVAIRGLSVNRSGMEELKAHPYISTALAKAIVQYREQHGLFPSIEALRKLYLMDETLFSKLAPYLKE
jgi:competence protein ComEA